MIVESVGHNFMLRLPNLPVKGPALLIDAPDPWLLAYRSRSRSPGRGRRRTCSCVRPGTPPSAVSTLQRAGCGLGVRSPAPSLSSVLCGAHHAHLDADRGAHVPNDTTRRAPYRSTRHRGPKRARADPLHGAPRRSAHSFTCRCGVYLVYVGRRARQREQRAEEVARAPRDRMARVQVTDETWAAYRASLGATPVSVALGKLVDREVATHRRRTAENAEEVRDAVRSARIVADELSSLIARLETKA